MYYNQALQCYEHQGMIGTDVQVAAGDHMGGTDAEIDAALTVAQDPSSVHELTNDQLVLLAENGADAEVREIALNELERRQDND